MQVCIHFLPHVRANKRSVHAARVYEDVARPYYQMKFSLLLPQNLFNIDIVKVLK